MSLLCAAGAVVQPAAQAQEQSASSLVAAISSAQARIDSLDVTIGDLTESVNQALVDLYDAQAAAEQARRGAEEAQRRLTQSQADVDAARAELESLTRTQYRNGGSPSPLAGLGSSDAQRDLLDRSMFLRQQIEEKQAKLDSVERARTEAANEESRLRLASEHAESTAQAAADAESQARSTLETNQAELDVRLAERDSAVEQHKASQEQLAQVRPEAAAEPATEPAAEPATAPATERVDAQTLSELESAVEDTVETTVAEIAPDAPAPSEEQVTQAVETALTLYGGDASASEDLSSQAASIAAAAALVGSSQAAHGGFENPYGSSSSELIAAFSSGLSSVLSPDVSSAPSPDVSSVLPDVPTAEEVSSNIADNLPAAPNSSKVETVIARAMATVGTPYVWGGGDANGPTYGVNGGSIKGFDCSGLVLYAFAGVGISLPHYTGYQYQRGTQVDPSQAQRGDLLFWGNNGDSHVAIYLGDGTMIEAPSAGQTVRVSPVRWSGMSPKAVRLL
ncbi:NlpC/P60 family protein [Corynebacterium sanguinis]|uniref:DIP1281 family NlpC/P60 protein n=1 Tax=Corynebacterium sanguinis TaxID=2594913 RepID=UPI00118486D8|nr:NlpC/P60 family protein [Corynebacterium sanguinis]MCT1411170.1 NlpC/P60 family protein [Corynebacterium sanguinis]MCT1444744.1 NlpC/P60 family protein [Corynebacterium sanguinis]MCT1492700.1 NlpC/P60 family protein [Corynebacterium sanguinis]MCT1596689.1 NlpC/P60 family protein [Corynebacterium sanguinis]MCT2247129.1 NlpC/P60 family protein [Corynebacterium sanguinis]